METFVIPRVRISKEMQLFVNKRKYVLGNKHSSIYSMYASEDVKNCASLQMVKFVWQIFYKGEPCQ